MHVRLRNMSKWPYRSTEIPAFPSRSHIQMVTILHSLTMPPPTYARRVHLRILAPTDCSSHSEWLSSRREHPWHNVVSDCRRHDTLLQARVAHTDAARNHRMGMMKESVSRVARIVRETEGRCSYPYPPPVWIAWRNQPSPTEVPPDKPALSSPNISKPRLAESVSPSVLS